jgi:hypothetical protein
VACCNLVHAGDTADAFNDEGITAEVIHGKLPNPERDAMLERLSNGTTTVLCFVGAVDEGADIPDIGCVVWARPTKSIRLRRQVNGRGRRIAPGKEELLVIDQTNSWSIVPLDDEPVAWDLRQGGEAGARSKRDTARTKTIRDEESGVIETVEITPAEFREVARATGGWSDNRPPLIEVIESCDSDRVMNFVRTRCQGSWGRHSQLKSALAWPGLTSAHVDLIGQALNWRGKTVAEVILEQAEVRAKRSLATFKAIAVQRQAREVLRSAIEAAVADGQLAPAAVDNLELIGVLAGSELVIAPRKEVADRIQGDSRLDAQKILEAALASRVAPYALTIGRLHHELSRSERLVSAFD